MMRFLCLFLLVGNAFADSWPRVAFAEWPAITVSQVTRPEPVMPTIGSVPGSVTNEYRRKPVVDHRQCNERRPDGTYIPVRC
ncbi:MAG: hypothetical protein ACM3X0_07325 [Bacteroidota bacterium]